jgi:hypothetical protein
MKQSGLGMRLLVGGYDISGDINAIDQISGGPALIDSTDITQSAHSRIPGLRDGHMAFTSFMDTANAHPVLKTLPRTDTIMAVLVGTTLGGPAACLNAKQINYDPTRAAGGDLKLKVQGDGNSYGLEWGLQLTAGLRTDGGAANGTGVDTVASAAFGGQAYLQVTAFTGTDVTVKIQDSADNITFADVTSFAFTQVTAAPASQRIVIGNTATIRRYVRATTVTSGGFSVATFSVVMNKNNVAGVVF